MKGILILKQDDLTLREISIDNIELIRKWRNDEKNLKWFINKNKITKEQQEKWYETYKNKHDDIVFIIEVNSMYIGTLSLYNIKRNDFSAEFGRIIIGEDKYRGKGYAYRSMKLLFNFAFNELNVKKIYLEVFKDNVNAIKLYKKIGFVQVSNIDNLIKMELEKHRFSY